MYTVFKCAKCEHNLYVEEVQNFGVKLAKIAEMPCPNCGEEGYENWILSCRKLRFIDDEDDVTQVKSY